MKSSKPWVCRKIKSQWKVGISAGGCGNYNPDKFWMNPQILIEIPQNYSGTKTDVIVDLMQKAGRFRKKETRDRVPECFIQFRVYKVSI